MKKAVTLLLVFALTFSMCVSTAFATNTVNIKSPHEQTMKRLSKPDTFLIDSHRIPSSLVIDGVEPYGDDPGVGAVDIDDILEGESRYLVADDRNFTNFGTFKIAVITVIKQVPKIGDIVKKGEAIYDVLKAIHSDLKYINSSKEVAVMTKYAYRDFYHELYVYDYDRTWKYVGYSQSRYYYKYLAMLYFSDKVGEHRWATAAFSHQNGYDPEIIAEAPNYMDYASLGNIAVRSWNTGRFYRETF